jgi:hypothetical protein
MDDEVKRGTIRRITARGGIIQLLVELPDKKTEVLTGDNGPTVRALIGIFGPDIVCGQSILAERVLGQQIGYELDDIGALAFLEP